MTEEKELLDWKEVNRVMEIRAGLRALTEGLRIKNGTGKFPRAVMTHEMGDAGFAFISCGNEIGYASRMMEAVLQSEDLRAFLKAFRKYHVAAERSARKSVTGKVNRILPAIRLTFDVRNV